MENLAPSLRFVLSMRLALESGQSLQVALRDYLRICQDDFSTFLIRYLCHFERGEVMSLSELKSQSQIALVQLLDSGLKGGSIYNSLLQLEDEIVSQCRVEVDQYTAKLSFRLLIPLLMFQFPAILILFLGALASFIERGIQ